MCFTTKSYLITLLRPTAGLIKILLVAVVTIAPVGTLSAHIYHLDAPHSPISVHFDGADGRISFTVKDGGAVWSNPSSGGDALVAGEVTQPDSQHLTATVKTKTGVGLQVSLALDGTTGDLTVALGGDPLTELTDGLQYPHAFFPADGSGYAIVPMYGGYAVPTAEVSWSAPWSHSRMEWFGGTDRQFDSGWMFIAEPAADMLMTVVKGDVQGGPRLGASFKWTGSNANPKHLPGRLSYERRAILHFFAHGGYVAQAKRFRHYAQAQGWFKSLREKATLDPEVDRLIGAPVIYLWGDGRSRQMLDGLQKAGVKKALIQLSVNHVDEYGEFPNREFADGDGWAKLVHEHGYLAGIYDIYAMARVGAPRGASGAGNDPRRGPGGRGLRYNGFSYLWPTEAGDWNYVGAQVGERERPMISHQMSAKFALETRLPRHITQFGLDAFFFDTVCALEPREDYDRGHGHAASRTQDITNRIALLDASTGHFRKLTGTEQIKSWAVPYVHWDEGMFKLGASNARGQVGSWNNNVYPQVMVDVQDVGAQLATHLSTGFQIPLWELVYHDAVVSVQHWHMPHNKLLYCWDLADQFALIRGQSPILNLVYNGEPGTVGRPIEGVKDAAGRFWDTRWTNPLVAAHVARTYETVSKWEEQVGYLEMTEHRLLVPDFSVQVSEFSGDGGTTGHGIVVNFGHFDGAHRMTGPDWKGEIRGHALTVPVGGFAEYAW